MLEIKRKDKQVEFKLKSGVLGYYWELHINCDSVVYAELLTEAYRKKLRDSLASIRKEAYLDGWKDAKAKNKKKDWFSSWW